MKSTSGRIPTTVGRKSHDFVHQMAFIKYHTEQALKNLSPIYTTDTGVAVKTHLQEAIALLDGIDHKLVSMALEGE